MKKYISLLFPLSVLGIIDSVVLTLEHFGRLVLPCANNWLFKECGLVLDSVYAVFLGVPLALWGVGHYGLLTLAIVGIGLNGLLKTKTDQKRLLRFSCNDRINEFPYYLIVILSHTGFLASMVFIYLQIFVLKTLCQYCTYSAIISTLVFILANIFLRRERKELFAYVGNWGYRYLVKPILFLFPAEFVHEVMVLFGKLLGTNPLTKLPFIYALQFKDKRLTQEYFGIKFGNPIGLSAGFDYDANLTQILPALDFGFGTVGTITHLPYGGNPRPMLGRLPRSKSLMVNKGFKSIGAKKIGRKLAKKRFAIPIGVSIGRTNSPILKNQKDSVKDIVAAFMVFEKAGVKNAYYELNISCPNLFGNITFYPPENLHRLLTSLKKLKLSKPVFVKMPLSLPNKEIMDIFDVITEFKFIKGVIIGNLQKDRSDKAFVKSEVEKWQVGNFSGKPCEERSNELIKLAFQKYGKKLLIIGCGGVFTGRDAYKKIKLGASLVEMITGMIYEGPTVISKINLELGELLEKDAYRNIKEVIGIESR